MGILKKKNIWKKHLMEKGHSTQKRNALQLRWKTFDISQCYKVQELYVLHICDV